MMGPLNLELTDSQARALYLTLFHDPRLDEELWEVLNQVERYFFSYMTIEELKALQDQKETP